MKSCELITYVSAIACFISESCSEEELPIICAILAQLNDTLKTVIIQRDVCKIIASAKVDKVLGPNDDEIDNAIVDEFEEIEFEDTEH